MSSFLSIGSNLVFLDYIDKSMITGNFSIPSTQCRWRITDRDNKGKCAKIIRTEKKISPPAHDFMKKITISVVPLSESFNLMSQSLQETVILK